MKSFAVFGDTHIDTSFSAYGPCELGADSILSSSWLPTLVEKLNTYSLPIVSIGDLYTNAENSSVWVSTIAHRLGLVSAPGNHDNETEGILPAVAPLCAAVGTGYKGVDPIWHDVTIGNFRIMTIHNMPYCSEDTVDQYENVNPAGGYSLTDWSGIGSPSSPQRIFMRAVMADAASKEQLLVVCGHRAVYGIGTGATGVRPNYIGARDATVEDGYPKGYVAELEDWAVANKTHVIHINGDQHTDSISYPIYRGAKSTSYGVIHVAITTMNPSRSPDSLDESIHYRWIYGGPGGGQVGGRTRYTSISNYSGWPTWLYQSSGLCPYIIVEKEWDGVYLSFYLWAHEGYQREDEGGPKAPEQLVESIKIPIVNGKLAGSISSVYGVVRPQKPAAIPTLQMGGGKLSRLSAKSF